ncbi:hypothetical protein BKG83_23735 [Mycobacteroides chelonae]|uniref:Uncharacterized protein n=1 Tax=Mycobacteroides chelonae TaxID=1774 RepID=A0A1S1LUD3_MYCCH|nr:hypothetical protein [Mycobacteroides chelonae]PKQ59523.1 hypothetical protein B5566_03435 [Mycobacterium sp. MHSD3]SKM80907.1 Uncharacterised protein [Mycobacteroides abscessus subsp. bolletii]MBF9521396.1 hypothetical protein [Mycobacteroides chelonae]OHU50251.1 hypothetical protein BKG83_23735 [Mycobacteroides chelonae]OHU75959.1 hypothetical protein BKG84_25445 [Mycobacteroides chelonae]
MSDTRLAALTARVEYTDPMMRARTAIVGGLVLLGPTLLVVLKLLDAAPTAIIAAGGAALTLAFVLRFFGPAASHRASVRLGVIDDHVVIGDEVIGHQDLVRPLAEVISVEISDTVADRTLVHPGAGVYRVVGSKYLTIGFRSRDADPSVPVQTVEVAANAADPVTEIIIRALHDAAPTDVRSPTEPTLSPTAASPAADERLWGVARQIHDSVLAAYGCYELDPSLFLRYPGVTDVTREPVMDFQIALAEAQALRTDTYPGDPALAGRYRVAVDTLRRTWARCEADGKSAALDDLPPSTRDDLATAGKLLAHAESASYGTEKAAYLRRVQDIVTRLSERGVVHPPRQVTVAIEAAARRALEA